LFSNGQPPFQPRGSGGSGKPSGPDQGGYTTEEEGASFESDRKFSNYILFAGSFALAVLFMAANVMHLKRERDAK
jgi:protein SCO1/2